MQNNVILNDDAKQTLTFSNIKDEAYNISLNNNNLKELTINVINSKLSIIENLISCLSYCQIFINIDNKSKLNLFTILVDNKNELAINRIVNNDGVYESMQIDLSNNKHILNFLTFLQDEVHRFTITYHRKLRAKAITKSELDDIEGIGVVKKRELLKMFGSVEKIKQASKEELMQVKGITEKIVEQIKIENK